MEVTQVSQQESFSTKLYNSLSASDNNLIFSPSSVYSSLAMAAVGSEGLTRQEFEQVLGFQNSNQLISYQNSLTSLLKQIPEISSGTKLLHSLKQMNNNFTSVMKTEFEGNFEYANFEKEGQQIAEQINDWVKSKTKGMIKDVVSAQQFSKWTKLFLVNTIYFKDEWSCKFKKADTKKDKFYFKNKIDNNENNNHKIVDMMYQKNDLIYYSNQDYQYAVLPYKNRNIRMEVFLPSTEMSDFEKIFTLELIKEARNKSDYHKTSLYFPKFKIEDKNSKNLIHNLQSIGLNECFDSNKANFQGISKECEIFINEICHKAIIEVNEEGTRAAVVTTTSFCLCAAAYENPSAVFYCNRPFIFLITSTNSNTCFFMGKLVNPENSDDNQNNLSFFDKIKNKFFS